MECVLTKKCAGSVGCSSCIFELNRCINSKWQLLSCVCIAFRLFVCWFIVTDKLNVIRVEKLILVLV